MQLYYTLLNTNLRKLLITQQMFKCVNNNYKYKIIGNYKKSLIFIDI